MSLFSKTEISKEILPFIENGEGVGVVKVNGYGKASARMESYKIIFDSYEGKSPIIESVSAITYLSYKKGNFLNEPKLEIGISHKKYILAGVDNNDAELETFYKTILDIKNLEKEQKRSSYMGINKPSIEDEAQNIESASNNVIEEDEQDLEEITQENIKEKEIVETDTNEEIPDSTEDLEKIIEEDDDDFEVLDEIDEEVEITEETKIEDSEVQVEETEAQTEEPEILDDENEIENSDEELIDDFEDDEEFEEIFIESDEPPEEDFNEENLLSDEPIIEDFDDDFEELDDFDDELADKDMNSGRIIKEPEETTQEDEIEDEVVVEEDISDEIEEEPEPVEEESKQEVVSQDNQNLIKEEMPQTTSQIDDNEITAENVTSEIGKLKQHLYGGINNIQNEFNKEKQYSKNDTAHVQFDPVDQIRRYHELKEDGIITEEEFELKKKQLLDL